MPQCCPGLIKLPSLQHPGCSRHRSQVWCSFLFKSQLNPPASISSRTGTDWSGWKYFRLDLEISAVQQHCKVAAAQTLPLKDWRWRRSYLGYFFISNKAEEEKDSSSIFIHLHGWLAASPHSWVVPPCGVLMFSSWVSCGCFGPFPHSGDRQVNWRL